MILQTNCMRKIYFSSILQIMLKIFLATIVVCLVITQLTEAYTVSRCKNACGNTYISRNARICSECARNPPINYEMCFHACGNTFQSDLRTICDKCVTRVDLSDQMCIKACGNTFSSQYRQICSRAAFH